MTFDAIAETLQITHQAAAASVTIPPTGEGGERCPWVLLHCLPQRHRPPFVQTVCCVSADMGRAAEFATMPPAGGNPRGH
jgi:hypothetical protein